VFHAKARSYRKEIHCVLLYLAIKTLREMKAEQQPERPA